MFKAAGIDTMEQCFNFAVGLHSHKRMVGTRQVLSEDEEMQPNGKVFQKWEMGDYTWKSYTEVTTFPTLGTYFDPPYRDAHPPHSYN
jgi:hypothetical protein